MAAGMIIMLIDKVSDDWNIKMINMKSEDVKGNQIKVKVALIDSGR